MIFRKPYALFIKYFRLLHGILSFLIFLLFFCSVSLYNFFRIYSVDFRSALTEFSPSKYLGVLNFIELFLIIVLFIIFLAVSIYKDKPKKAYIFGLLIYVYVLVYYYITNVTLIKLDSSYVLEVMTTNLYRDFALIGAILQFVSFIFALVRTLGFDIKNFDFSSDLEKMDISEKDSEEIEVALNIDKNEGIRKGRFALRNAKYFYFEHKFFINIGAIGVSLLLVLVVYFSSRAYYKNYNQGQPFSVNGYSMNVQDSYILDSDVNGVKLVSEGDNPGAVLAIRFQVKSSASKQTFNMGLVSLRIGEFVYKPSVELANNLYDIGTAYDDDVLSDEYETYILAFEIPSKFASKKMKLRVNDSNSFVKGERGRKNIFVKLDTEDLRKDAEVLDYKVGDELIFNDTILSSSYLKIDGFDIGSKFKVDYKYCYRDDKCIDSYEYVSPTLTGNYFKTLLRLSGKFNIDSKLNISGIGNLKDFVDTYGYIHYLDGENLTKRKISSSDVKLVRAKSDDCFVEVPYDVLNSSSVYLTFKIRNKTFKYVLK